MGGVLRRVVGLSTGGRLGRTQTGARDWLWVEVSSVRGFSEEREERRTYSIVRTHLSSGNGRRWIVLNVFLVNYGAHLLRELCLLVLRCLESCCSSVCRRSVELAREGDTGVVLVGLQSRTAK